MSALPGALFVLCVRRRPAEYASIVGFDSENHQPSTLVAPSLGATVRFPPADRKLYLGTYLRDFGQSTAGGPREGPRMMP